ncbi:hypothetical protein [Pedobacter sp. B4-66]|uniref:hypothetical protein n=1 Tax=Pedobacter sp. B4-66 TaxID=2817280 RepID=UPI001BDA0DD2|nr:hypothetical protein [Pedobacter sp. B4-66]
MNEDLEDVSDEKEFLLSKTLSTKINRRSEMAQEILSNKPDWLERNALFIFLGIILLLFSGTWIVKYPDFITAKFKLTSANAPKAIISRHQGRLVKLLVKNNISIRENEVIGFMESTANHEEVIQLSDRLTKAVKLMEMGKENETAQFFNLSFQNLGELQQKYQMFIATWQIFVDYSKNGFYEKKINSLKSDMAYQDSLRTTIVKKQELILKDLDLAAENFSINKGLLDKGIITKAEYREENSKFLNKQSLIPEMDASLLSSSNQKRDKQKEIDQLVHDEAQQNVIFYQSLQSLKSAVDEWKKEYIIQSPTNGITNLNGALQENQFLQNGSIIGYVNPDKGTEYVEIKLSQTNFGKIDTGLNVQLRLDAFPYQEFGFLDGTINYVSNIATDSGFLATVKLSKGLKTNNNLEIPYRNGLSGQALIITKNMRLFDRIYYNTIKSTSVGQ